MEKAIKLLSETNKPLKQIINIAGYNNISSFCRAFKKFYRITPTQFRYKNKLKELTKMIILMTIISFSLCSPKNDDSNLLRCSNDQECSESFVCQDNKCISEEDIPVAPSNFTATTLSSSEVKLSWQDNSNNEDGFEIYRCRMPLCEKKGYAGSVGLDKTEFIDTDLSGNTEYCYYVAAYRDKYRSPSNNSCATTNTDSRIAGTLLWLYILGDNNNGFSFPAIADINNDGKNEVIIGSSDGRMNAINGYNGTLLWSFFSGDKGVSSPTIVDANKDGYGEVIFTSHNYIYSLSGKDGTLLWSRSNYCKGICSPSIGDVNNDTKLELIVTSSDWRVRAISTENGDINWESAVLPNIDKTITSTAISDLDGDGTLEVIVGAYGSFKGSSDGALYVLNGLDGSTRYQLRYSSNASSLPVIGDIDNDGHREIIIWISGQFLSLNGYDGAIQWANEIPDKMFPDFTIIGGLNNDFKSEIIIGYSNGFDGKVKVLNGEDGVLKWSTDKVFYSAASGDVDGDGVTEILGSSLDNRLYVLNGEDGSVLWSFVTSLGSNATPSIGDVNNDGQLEVVVASSDRGIYAIRTGAPVPAPSLLPWPKFRHDLWNTGSNSD